MKSSLAPRRVRVWHLLTFTSLVGGAACGADDRPAPMSVGLAGSGADAGRAHAGTTNVPSEGGAGAAGSAQDAGAASMEGGAAGQATGGAGGIPGEGPPNVGGDPGLMVDPCDSDTALEPASFQGVCSAEATWDDPAEVVLDSSEPPSLIAMTPDELSVVWSEAPSSVPTYFLADRTATDAAFAEPRELPFTDVLGLSPDGLRLTLRESDGTLAEAIRTDRASDFATPTPGAYAALAADALAHRLHLGDLVMAPDDKTLYYTAWSLEDQTLYPLRVSSRTADEEWPVGVTLEGCAFKAYGAFGPRPTAASSDGLTLFYFDAARSTARAAFRSSTDADFGWFSDLPQHVRPQPNTSCDRLYYSPRSGTSAVLAAARSD